MGTNLFVNLFICLFFAATGGERLRNPKINHTSKLEFHLLFIILML